MSHTFYTILFPLSLFLGMLFFMETGRRIGIRRMAQDPDGAKTGVGAMEAAIFGLMGLLVAFTFSGAASRFDTRRQLIVEETNAIGTAYLRLDLLPSDAQARLRAYFREYVDSRLESSRKTSTDFPGSLEAYSRSMKLQAEIWNQAVVACRDQGLQSATMLLLPALNQMIDITTTRLVAQKTHPPAGIFLVLSVLALFSAMFAGYGTAGSKARSWIHMIGFGAMMAVTVYLILDIEYPRHGFIQVSSFDEILEDLQKNMK
jgi:hypothetical protein